VEGQGVAVGEVELDRGSTVAQQVGPAPTTAPQGRPGTGGQQDGDRGPSDQPARVSRLGHQLSPAAGRVHQDGQLGPDGVGLERRSHLVAPCGHIEHQSCAPRSSVPRRLARRLSRSQRALSPRTVRRPATPDRGSADVDHVETTSLCRILPPTSSPPRTPHSTASPNHHQGNEVSAPPGTAKARATTTAARTATLGTTKARTTTQRGSVGLERGAPGVRLVRDVPVGVPVALLQTA